MSIDLSKRYLVLGIGITGASVVHFLREQGVLFRVADSRAEHCSVAELRAQYTELDLVVGEFNEQLLEGIDVLVINPGLSQQLPVVQAAIARGIEIVGDIELFSLEVDCPVVAVTGTNGKSTVVSMFQAMGDCSALKILCGGNIGEPALNLLGQGADVIVLELSSYQLETTRHLRPVVASVLNVSEDHMDRYIGLKDYAAAKQNIFRHAVTAVWLKSDQLTKPKSRELQTIAVCTGQPYEGDYGVVGDGLYCGEEQLFDLRLLGAPGRHNELNACFAWAMGAQVGLSASAMSAGLVAFTGLEHRTELVAEIDGVKYFNDSKGTNVGATLVALQSMRSKVVLLAGGDGKSQDFRPLLPALQQCARAVITYGADGDQVADVARGALPVFSVDSLEAAVALGSEQAMVGDCVLLSPACASFDMFKSYQDRGRVFVSCVERLRA